jgi:DNA uptake protein ComE-like DNA-binding protein
MTTKARLSLIFVTAVIIFTATACGDGTTPNEGTTSPMTTGQASAPPGPTQPAPAKVSANTASQEEIEAALRNAGVSNPERWAEEVIEYRPYPADDPNLTKLRDNLAKYNPGQETLDKIISALTP